MAVKNLAIAKHEICLLLIHTVPDPYCVDPHCVDPYCTDPHVQCGTTVCGSIWCRIHLVWMHNFEGAEPTLKSNCARASNGMEADGLLSMLTMLSPSLRPGCEEEGGRWRE
eukprot:1259562-Rhodomonas_salina.1